MRVSIPLALPRRAEGGQAAPRAQARLPRAQLCCPLVHLMVVIANSVQLIMMICFLGLLLARLEHPNVWSWSTVFTPLWISDAITLITSLLELRRIYNATSANTK